MLANPIVSGQGEVVPLLGRDSARHVLLRVRDHFADDLVLRIVFVIEQFFRHVFEQHYVGRASAYRCWMNATSAHLQHVVAAGYVEAVFKVADLISHGYFIAVD